MLSTCGIAHLADSSCPGQPRCVGDRWGQESFAATKMCRCHREELTNKMVWVLWVLPVGLLAPRGQDSLTPFTSTACVDPFLLFTTQILADLHPSCGYQGASQANPS